MAGKFESLNQDKKCVLFTAAHTLFVIHFVFSSLFVTFGKPASVSNSTKWFKTYENVTVFIDSPNWIRFDSLGNSYLISLFNNNILLEHLNKTVVGKSNTPFSSADLVYDGVYEGLLIAPFNGRAVVKFVNRELDIIIMTENDALILEPFCRYFLTKEGICEQADGEVFRNIFYKGSDVNLTLINWNSSYSSLPTLSTNVTANAENRRKRSSDAARTECTLHIVADHTFYEQTGHRSVSATIAEVVFLISEANQIFRSTDFNGDGSGDNIGFYVSKITIYDDSGEYLMSEIDDVSEYLTTFSEYNFDDYCLATGFTSKDFDDGVIGLAWVASSSFFGSAGGVCQRRILYRGIHLSLNTNIVTNINNGERMPTFVTVLTLAHELGHNFGSPHDPVDDPACAPGENYGNFLMYPYASQGDRPNNYIFSPCSISYMYPVIKNKGTCFQEPVSAVCGNGQTEDGEECDCGISSICEHVDPCCTPSDVSSYHPDSPCTYRRSEGFECSAKTSMCCTNNCLFIPSSANKVCKVATDCTYDSVCNGTSEFCPGLIHVADATPCSSGRKSCIEGKCIGSICTSYSMDPCTCSGIHACHICCSANGTACAPLLTEQPSYINRPTGESCNSRQGFCNSNGECVLTDTSSTLDRLNSMFTDVDVESVKQWIIDHWFYVKLAIVSFFVMTAVFIYTYRNFHHVQTSAYMYGKYSRIQREADMQKSYLKKRRAEVKQKFMKKIREVSMSGNKRCFVEAVARLLVFFPTANKDTVIQTLRSSGSEEVCVKWLLIRNYPFRKFYQPEMKKSDKTMSTGRTTLATVEEQMQPLEETSDGEDEDEDGHTNVC